MILSQQNNVDFAFQQGHFAPCATTPNQPTQQALIHHQFSFEDVLTGPISQDFIREMMLISNNNQQQQNPLVGEVEDPTFSVPIEADLLEMLLMSEQQQQPQQPQQSFLIETVLVQTQTVVPLVPSVPFVQPKTVLPVLEIPKIQPPSFLTAKNNTNININTNANTIISNNQPLTPTSFSIGSQSPKSIPGTPPSVSDDFNNNTCQQTNSNKQSFGFNFINNANFLNNSNNNYNSSCNSNSKFVKTPAPTCVSQSPSPILSIKSKEPITHPRCENGTWKYYVILELENDKCRDSVKKQIEQQLIKFRIRWTGANPIVLCTNNNNSNNDDESFVEATNAHANVKIRDGSHRVVLPANQLVVDFQVNQKIKSDDSSANCEYDLRIIQGNNRPPLDGNFIMGRSKKIGETNKRSRAERDENQFSDHSNHSENSNSYSCENSPPPNKKKRRRT